MSSYTGRWRCLFVPPNHLELCLKSHVVGPSSYPPLLEVAVPLYIPLTHPLLDLPQVAPVSIDSLIDKQEVLSFGYCNAQTRALYRFLHQASAGVEAHGAELGQYYRDRYPNLRPWIEYIILLRDLPPAIAPHRLPVHKQMLRDNFSRAVVFLALSSMKSQEPAACSIRAMSSDQVIATLRRALEVEFANLHHVCQASLNNIALIRNILIQVGGLRNDAQLDLLDIDSTYVHISEILSILMGGPQTTHRQTMTELIQQLSETRSFINLHVNEELIVNMTEKLELNFWVWVTNIPSDWTAGFSSQSWKSLRVLSNESLGLCHSLQEGHNAEKIFSVWAYLVRHTYPDARDSIQRSAGGIFSRACQSLQVQISLPQMTLDLMTMTCISRLFPTKGAKRSSHSSSINALDAMFRKSSTEDMSMTTNRLLASLHRVLIADDFSHRDPKLSHFISQIGLPNLMLELYDSHTDQYWAYRIRNHAPHSAAFGHIGLRVGDFPVKLSPLRQSPEEYSTMGIAYYADMVKAMRGVIGEKGTRRHLEDAGVTEDTEVAEGAESAGTSVLR
ncbi:hypothetical protein EDB81DRAFT_906189 [Dactylonectria macrodidyma]|uniref:Uncharacterized protein n=1 Tax=Dactylonectria macrodidyma TaxID=307937 RepID=A0A9P9E5C0_9HYPO|nr:hypothetical protein EDB81DRAFT_906189 [Dactylonectria macrodidyma]